MSDSQPHRPTSLQKLLFWAILGGISVFFVEISLGSYPFAFFDAWGLLAVCPLYLLHVLVLGRIVFLCGRPRFPTLFFAGVLLGLYEAYMTKQLWNPDWSQNPVRIGGVAAPETIILALWWHPFMAFIVPLLVGETILCRSRDVARALPLRLKRALFGKRRTTVLVVLAILSGLLASSAHTTRPSVVHIIVSIVGSVGVLSLLVWLWKRATRGVRMTLPELLPTNREFVLLCVLLGLQYVGLGIILRPEAMPGLGPQASIWLLYAVFIACLWLSMRRPRPVSVLELRDPPERSTWKLWLGLAAVLVVTATVSRLALGPGTWLFMIANAVIGVPIGAAVLVLCVVDILRRRPAGRRA
jgi:hypothetical protein